MYNNNQTARQWQQEREEDRSFFFLKPTVIPIFLPITDSTSYNIVLLFHYRLFSKNFNLTTFVLNIPSFSFYFFLDFSSFFVFFQTASFTFLSLCIFVSISHLPLEILCLVQYRTALNKGKWQNPSLWLSCASFPYTVRSTKHK
jgi:hypothetical protein